MHGGHVEGALLDGTGLGGPIGGRLADVADVLLELGGLLHAEHGAGDEGTGVLVSHHAQEVVGPLHGLGADLDVVVHQDHVGGLRGLLHRLDHAAREAAGTAHVGVGMNVDAVRLELIDIEGPAVVDHVEGEVVGDVLVGT